MDEGRTRKADVADINTPDWLQSVVVVSCCCTTGARSSAGQSIGLLSRGSEVRILPGASMSFCRRAARHLLCSVLLIRSLEAQQPVRVTWPLADFIVLGDSSKVTLLASPNLSTMVGSEDVNLTRLSFDPVSVRRWTEYMRRAVDSIARLRRVTPFAVITPLVNMSAQAYIGIGATAGKQDERFLFVLDDSAGGHRWRTEASAKQVDTMLGALGAVADRLPNPMPSDTCAGEVRLDSIPAADTAVRMKQKPPELLTHTPLMYPFNEQRLEREGRVWLRFVVDKEGRPEPGSFCVLLSDGSGFTVTALQWFRAARYAPSQFLGQPVRALVFEEVRFTLPLHEDR